MAYCRSDGEKSDVFLVKSLFGFWECYHCKIYKKSIVIDTIGQVMIHLQDHKRVNHKVPIHVFDRVQSEIDKYGTNWNGER